MRIAWITDPHLNHYRPGGAAFGREVLRDDPDAVVITGDIAESGSIRLLLTDFAEAVGVPVYFVLGNHDAYYSSIARTQQTAKELTAAHYLTRSRPIRIGNSVLAGHDGFYDARSGDPMGSGFGLWDFEVIEELANLPRMALVSRLHELAARWAPEAAASLDEAALMAGDGGRVLFATHVPPFPGAAWHRGELSNAEARPWFVSVTMGETLIKAAERYTSVHFDVLCGHSHSEGILRVLDNLIVYTGEAEYGRPAVYRVLHG